MRRFSTFVALDWSGAKGERHRGIAVAMAEGDRAPQIVRPGHRWSRGEVVAWLAMLAEDNADALIGFDFSASFPFADQGAFFPGWGASPTSIPALWALVEEICAQDHHLEVSSFLTHPEARRHFRHGRDDVGDLFGSGLGRLRRVEHHQRRTKQAASASVFSLIGANQVGKASLTGMRVLHRLHPHIPMWPLDPVPQSGPCLIEIYSAVAARAAQLRAGISKIRDGAALDSALAALGSKPARQIGPISDDLADALLTAAWMRRAADIAALWSPALLDDSICKTEGWTFGIV